MARRSERHAGGAGRKVRTILGAAAALGLAACQTPVPGPVVPPAEIEWGQPARPALPRPAQPSVPRPAAPRPRPSAPPPHLRPAVRPTADAYDFRTTLAMQTLLDRHLFSCNCLDGEWSERTRQTLLAWQRARHLPDTGRLDEATQRSLGSLESAFTTHVVTAADLARLAPVPPTWLGKSQAARLEVETVLEAMVEQYHASKGALRRLNPALDWPDPPVGTVIAVPHPRPAPTPRAARLRISLERKLIRAYDERGTLLALFPCSIARDKAKRPVGVLHVSRCAAQPNYYFDPAVFAEDREARQMDRRLVLPPGPNNPVGMAWIGLDREGYGIHGTPRPEEIGRTESHGCFRLANWNAERLLRMVAPGTPVIVEE